MKTLWFVLLLVASTAFVLLGCSDNSTQPVSPADQSAQPPPSPAKQISTLFTFTDQPIAPLSGGSLTLRGGVWQSKDRHIVEIFASSDPYVAGIMEEDFSTTIDAVTGEGPFHGKWKITPSNTVLTGGGSWEGTLEGYRTGPNQDGTWSAIVKAVGHGKGGTIDGWKITSTTDLTIYPSPTPPPFPLFAGWIGKGNGYYFQH